jgi:hypothetical protein
VDQILAEENVDNGTDETVQWTLTDHLKTVRDIASIEAKTVFWWGPKRRQPRLGGGTGEL